MWGVGELRGTICYVIWMVVYVGSGGVEGTIYGTIVWELEVLGETIYAAMDGPRGAYTVPCIVL